MHSFCDALALRVSKEEYFIGIKKGVTSDGIVLIKTTEGLVKSLSQVCMARVCMGMRQVTDQRTSHAVTMPTSERGLPVGSRGMFPSWKTISYMTIFTLLFIGVSFI